MDFYDPQIQDFVEPLETYRFFEVLADDVPERYPWRGNGLYSLEVVEYLLDKGIIAKQNVTRALQHTLEIPMETFKTADQKIVDMVYNFGKEYFMRENDVKQIVKAMRLKFLGLAGRDTNIGPSQRVSASMMPPRARSTSSPERVRRSTSSSQRNS